MILPLMDKLNRQRSAGSTEADDTIGTMRSKPKHRSRPPVKFVLKDTRSAPLDLDQDPSSSLTTGMSPTLKRVPSESQALTFPVLLGKVRRGFGLRLEIAGNVCSDRRSMTTGCSLGVPPEGEPQGPERLAEALVHRQGLHCLSPSVIDE